MASLEGNKFPPLTRRWNDREREQIRISALQFHHMRSPDFSEYHERNQRHGIGFTESCMKQQSSSKSSVSSCKLPKTLDDALRPTSRAIVVTETIAPFRVVKVNKAWEMLCGYSHIESKGKSLGSLLKGEETNQIAVTAMINKLLEGEEATAIVTNYTKEGRKFRNRVHVGPLYHDHGRTTESDVLEEKPSYYVGVLKEV